MGSGRRSTCHRRCEPTVLKAHKGSLDECESQAYEVAESKIQMGHHDDMDHLEEIAWKHEVEGVEILPVDVGAHLQLQHHTGEGA